MGKKHYKVEVIKMLMEISSISKKFGNQQVLENFDISIQERKITCILGASGCGKTTLLNMIAGLLKADSGSFVGFSNKKISFIFQEHRLLEWMTVEANIDFVIRQIYDKSKRRDIIEKHLKIVELEEYKKYYPHELSGGMKQRTSIARAFSYPGEILLMDEPFKAIDVKLKLSVMDSFIKLWKEDRRTVVFVTHDVEEALLLGDNICLLAGNPPYVDKTFQLDIPQEERGYQDERLKNISKEIFKYILN